MSQKLHVTFVGAPAVPTQNIEAALQQHGISAKVNSHFSTTKDDYSADIKGQDNIKALDAFCAKRGLPANSYVEALTLVARESAPVAA